MAGRFYTANGGFKSMPKPVNLNLPEVKNSKPKEKRNAPAYRNNGYGDRFEEGYENQRAGGYDDLKIYLPETRNEAARVHRVRPNANPEPRRRKPPSKRPQGRTQYERPRRKGLLSFAGLNFSLGINPLYRQVAIVCIGLVTIVAVGIILIQNAFADNALRVMVDGQEVGFIPLTPVWSSEAFHTDAVTQLMQQRGTGVTVEQRVSLELARVPRSDLETREVILSQIVNHHFTYRFTAVAVYVTDGYGRRLREGLLRSHREVEEARELFAERYVGANTVDVFFRPDWELVPMEVVEAEATFSAPHDLFARLDRPVRTAYRYVVQGGDSVHRIATRFGVQQQEILLENNLTINCIIHPGQVLVINLRGPFINVYTIEESSRIEVLNREVQIVPVNDLPPGGTRLIQEGRDGEHRAVTRITRRNGIEIDREYISGEILIEQQPRIIEQGE